MVSSSWLGVKLASWLVILLAPGLLRAEEPVLATLYLDSQGQYQVELGSLNRTAAATLATANYTNRINETGWAFLDLATNGEWPDKVQAFGAGYIEGYLTSELLYMHYQNTVVGRCEGKEAVCGKVADWLDRNHKWIRTKIKKDGKRSRYWHQVSLFYDQLVGITEGYSAAQKAKGDLRGGEITIEDIFTMNAFGDMEDLEPAVTGSKIPRVLTGEGHCSALIRLLPGNTDLLAAHDTWTSYQSMLRILKRYDIPFKQSLKSTKLVPGHTMAFSSYPGLIYSGDDFTVISSGLTTLETTIGNSNASLWPLVVPESVLEGIRSVVANRLATNGQEWTSLFESHNSGTYNNQWMVVDYNQFRPGWVKQGPGLLWVLEQLPGFVRSEDLTSVLTGRGFWPSYNSPYFPDVYNRSGNRQLWEQYGDWFSYERTPRAVIFERETGSVERMEDMVQLMRYNNYVKDPASACNCTPPYSAENAISARCDLNPRYVWKRYHC
jgi:hypothetical protein